MCVKIKIRISDYADCADQIDVLMCVKIQLRTSENCSKRHLIPIWDRDSSERVTRSGPSSWVD